MTRVTRTPASTALRWLQALLLACGLNLGLFLLMPALINTRPPKPEFEVLVDQVQLTRIQRPEPKQPPKKVEPPKPKPIEKPKPTVEKLAAPKLRLPFELNPRLPSGPTTLDLPPLETGLPTTTQGQAFDVGALDGPMTVLAQVPPIYPIRARQRNIQGWVKVRFVVNEQGEVGQVQVLKADPPGYFERSVERCVRSWRFQPGTIGGTAVKALVEQTITFKLE